MSIKIAVLVVLLILAGISLADETDPDDLGVISPRRALLLEKPADRKDFARFILEFLPQQWPTNKVVITTTNTVVYLGELVAVPHGPAVLAVRSECTDGSVSDIKLFKVDIRRNAPSAPRVRTIGVLTNDDRQAVEPVVHRWMHRARPTPPVPGQTNRVQGESQPLPGGRPETYSEGVDRMRRFYAERQSKGTRRSE